MGFGDGTDLVRELFDACDDADRFVRDMRRLGVVKAEAERRYRVAKAKRTLYERDENRVQMSIICDVVRGCEEVSNLAFARDCAEAEYDGNREALLVAKKKIDTLREIMAREWAGEGR